MRPPCWTNSKFYLQYYNSTIRICWLITIYKFWFVVFGIGCWIGWTFCLSFAQNLYVLKLVWVYLKSQTKFEIWQWNLNLILFLYRLKAYIFQTWTLQSGVMCVSSQPHVIKLNTYPWDHINIWNNFSDWNEIVKKNSIWHFKWIEMDFQEIENLSINCMINSVISVMEF